MPQEILQATNTAHDTNAYRKPEGEAARQALAERLHSASEAVAKDLAEDPAKAHNGTPDVPEA